MEVEIIKSEKEDLEVKVDNLTVAEVLRAYLNKQGVKFAAWRKEHPSKPVVFKIQSTSNAKKEVSDAIKAIEKDLDAMLKNLKK